MLSFCEVGGDSLVEKGEEGRRVFGVLSTEKSAQQVPGGRCWKDVWLRYQLNEGFGRYLLDLQEGGSHSLVEKGGEGGGIFVGMF